MALLVVLALYYSFSIFCHLFCFCTILKNYYSATEPWPFFMWRQNWSSSLSSGPILKNIMKQTKQNT